MHICCLYAYTHTNTHVYSYVDTHAYAHASAHVYVHTSAHVYVYVSTCIPLPMSVPMYTHMFATHMPIHIHVERSSIFTASSSYYSNYPNGPSAPKLSWRPNNTLCTRGSYPINNALGSYPINNALGSYPNQTGLHSDCQ